MTVDSCPSSTGDGIEDHLDTLLPGSNRKTLSQYRCVLRHFNAFVGNRAQISDLKAERFEGFRAYLLGRGCAERTAVGYLAILRMAWRRAGRLPLPGATPYVRGLPSLAEPGCEPRLFWSTLDRSYPPPLDANALARDLIAWFFAVYRLRKLVGRSPKTIKTYRAVFVAFLRYLGRRPTLDDLADDSILKFMETRLAYRSVGTVETERARLVALANYAARKKLIPEFPDVTRPPHPQRQPEAWTTDQLRRLLAAYRNASGTMDGLPAGDWFYSLHLLALYTGERCSALLAVRWDWVDCDTGWLSIPAEVRKGRTKAMRYPLPSAVVRAVSALQRAGRDYVFSAPARVRTDAFYSRMATIQREAGLPHGRFDKLHRMRRTFASLVEKAGGDATQALAHSSRRVTERYLDETIIGRSSATRLVETILPVEQFLPAVHDDNHSDLLKARTP